MRAPSLPDSSRRPRFSIIGTVTGPARHKTDLHPGQGMTGRVRTDAPGHRPQCGLCRYRRHSIMTVSRQVCPFHGDEDIQWA